MSEEILINSTPVQTRVALVESGVLQEIYVERSSHKGLVGNIYFGRVMRVLPGMQAAFVDIGLERASFLHASDLVTLDSDGIEVRSDETRDIRDLVCEGQSLVVHRADRWRRVAARHRPPDRARNRLARGRRRRPADLRGARRRQGAGNDGSSPPGVAVVGVSRSA